MKLDDQNVEPWKLISTSVLWSKYLKDVKVGSLLKVQAENQLSGQKTG